MKIIILSHLFPGENDEFNGVCNLSRAKALKRSGNEILIIKPLSVLPPINYIFPLPRVKKLGALISKIFKMPQKYIYGGFPVIAIKWCPLPKRIFWWEQIYFFNYFIGKKIKKILEEYKPDAVITVVTHPEGTYTRYLKEICGCPIISIAEGSEVLLYPKLYRGIEKIVETLNKYSDRVIFVSENMASSAVEKYNFKKWCIIKNGYENSIFTLSLKNLSRDMKSVLSVGSLEFNKGHDLLLNAILELPGWKLTIVGDGRLHQQYLNFIKEHRLTERVKIVQYLNQADLKKLYQSNGLFCMPSRSESFGVAAMEALSCGMPVIGSNTGIMGDVIKNRSNGFILSELTSLCIEETLINASKHPWDQEKIAATVKGYSWDKWAKDISSLIENISLEKREPELLFNP